MGEDSGFYLSILDRTKTTSPLATPTTPPLAAFKAPWLSDLMGWAVVPTSAKAPHSTPSWRYSSPRARRSSPFGSGTSSAPLRALIPPAAPAAAAAAAAAAAPTAAPAAPVPTAAAPAAAAPGQGGVGTVAGCWGAVSIVAGGESLLSSLPSRGPNLAAVDVDRVRDRHTCLEFDQDGQPLGQHYQLLPIPAASPCGLLQAHGQACQADLKECVLQQERSLHCTAGAAEPQAFPRQLLDPLHSQTAV